MLGRLLTLAVVLGVAYWILTQATPLLRRAGINSPRMEDSATDSIDASCVARARQTNDLLVAAARNFGQPPVDVDGWTDAVWRIESELQTARSICVCPSEACRAATDGLDEMGSLLTNLDGMVRGDSPGFANPGNQQERILRDLDRARAAVGF